MNRRKLNTILNRLHCGLSLILGEHLDRMILYGSQARGEARHDSDVDVLIVITGDFSYEDLISRTSKLIAELSLEYDVVLSRAFISAERFEHEQTPFMLNVHREGVTV